MISAALVESLWLTLRLAALTTMILVAIGLPLAQWLNTTRWKGAIVVETLVTLPIVLPPTVIGFYLLVLFAPQTALGGIWKTVTGDSLAFSFAGIVVGSVIYSLPFAVQPFQRALKSVPRGSVESARLCGASRLQIFRYIILPLASSGIGTGVILSFAHTVGEFGVVLMIGGSIPGTTRVASIALYDEVQKLNYPAAQSFAFILVTLSFAAIFAMALIQRRGWDYRE